MPENKGWKSPYLLLTITMLLWGSAFSSSKSVVAQMPHTVAALLRFGGGAVALLAAVALFGRPAAPASARGGGRAALAGLLGVFAYNGFFFWGLSLAPSLDAGILIPVLSPVLTSAFLLVTGRDRPSGARLAGLALGLAGAVVFFFGAGGSAHGGATRLSGDLLYLLSAVCWAAYTLIGPRVLAGVDPLRATTYATCAGAVLLGVLAAPDLGETHWSALPPGLWLNVVFLAIGPAAVANLLYYRGVGAVGPASASLMMFMVPVINTGCAMLFLGESFGGLQALGALVLLSGAVLAVTRGRGSARPRVGTAPTAEKKPSEL
ncbi:DMT family transporter [Streptomyces melanosporofaciens]|uniref:Permease of the drug/metabolite transporter (DMT) superfamily n=1 Tax=Streptomyces melanosporofaciens TaxID=67327 RepID=A0A1H5BMN0_STRMJ|nr:DMT family transporter [Streptomyces melanosporofaciens]SED55655.1 Permease of the drug/metabolite transporter (DMT) superfamily [Streptomyces melanosporofaciens]